MGKKKSPMYNGKASKSGKLTKDYKGGMVKAGKADDAGNNFSKSGPKKQG